MPIYNAAQDLAASIDSICRQSFSDWELLCVDDGSTDSSNEIVEAIARSDSRIRLIKRSHEGIVASLNAGIQAAQSDLIARMDGDDLASPNRLQKQWDYLQNQPELALIGSAYQTMDATGQVWKHQVPPERPDAVFQQLKRTNCIAHSTVLMRRSALEAVSGPYRSQFPFAEDYDLWLRLAERFPIGNIPQILVSYRRDLRSPKSDSIVQQVLSTLAVQHCHQRRMEGVEDPANRWPVADRIRLIESGFRSNELDFQLRRRLLSDARIATQQGLLLQASLLADCARSYLPFDTGLIEKIDFHYRRWRAKLGPLSQSIAAKFE
jgi:hypothetical protein